MKLFLRDRNIGMCDAWQDAFGDDKDVHISCGDIFESGPWMDADAIVSPANSFGFMDGGIDLAYSKFLGWKVSERLRFQLKNNEMYRGELPVGCAEGVFLPDVNSKPFKYLISAPTMRVPEDVSKTVNAYLAFNAALIKANRLPAVRSILCPGLGTAVGKMSYENCALQMRLAWANYEHGISYKGLHAAQVVDHSMKNPEAFNRMKYRTAIHGNIYNG